MLDLMGGLILGVFVLLGARRGTLVTSMSLVTLVAAYAAGVLAATYCGAALTELLQLPRLLGPPLAGTVAFVFTFLAFGLSARALSRWEQERRGSKARGALDRLGGGLLGGVRGVLVVVLLGWLALWLDAARTLRAPAGGEPTARQLAAGSAVGTATQQLVEAGAEAALSDAGPGGQLAARVLARPTQTLGGVRSLVENPRVKQLSSDRAFWSYVEHGAIDAAQNRASFYRILHDRDLRQELARVGLIGEEAASDPAVFRSEAKEVLAALGPQLQRLRADPELAELARDPQVAAALQQGNVLALLRHPSFQSVVSRALSHQD